MLKFRPANFNDIENILEIVSHARKTLKENGINQWQGEYPAASDFENDIMRNGAYVLEFDSEIVGMGSILFGKKKEYEEIDGSWVTNDAYAVINRVGISKNQIGKGISHKIFAEFEKISFENEVFSIRVDTCPENSIMRRLVGSRGYSCRGIIQGNGGIRKAYEKILSNEILAKV